MHITQIKSAEIRQKSWGGGVKNPLRFISRLAMVCALFFNTSAFGYTIKTDNWIRGCLSEVNCCAGANTGLCGDTESPSETTPGFTWSARVEALEEGNYACKCNKELYCLADYYLKEECKAYSMDVATGNTICKVAVYECVKCPEYRYTNVGAGGMLSMATVQGKGNHDGLGLSTCYIPSGAVQGYDTTGDYTNDMDCVYVPD